MFQNIFTQKQDKNCMDKIKKIQDAMEKADAVVIGAGAGLPMQANDSINIFLILK